MAQHSFIKISNDTLRRPETSLSTCRRRVENWLRVAEFMLYRPMCDELERQGTMLIKKV
ncbi:DUF1133 family protein [Xenorhabdus innexi]|uniref:ATP-dependent Zn protease n=1 Tax=Xenorhabdus innexi TaxID=290109 RepID=A0A1N6MWD7_9GAMM|nr:DUF1133 family protein [Xenorhabdus innexi]PHM36608.1 ATP-dependent Zn protease [Xenorhabdus innexi]SIP73156.1 hypothetical protein XIS1_1750048 [Xenorhabdus innexi]